MNSNNYPKMLRSIGSYISESFRFYTLKSEYTAPLAFVLILAVYFFGSYLFAPDVQNIDIIDTQSLIKLGGVLSHVLIVSFFSNIIINLIASIYLAAYIGELKGGVCPVSKIPGINVRNIARIFIAHIIIYGIIPIAAYLMRSENLMMIVSIGFSLMIIPFVIVYIIVFFNNCFILDGNKGVIASFKLSAALSRGHRLEILSVVLIFKFITSILLFFASSFFATSEGGLVQNFAVSFASALFALMEMRIVALMYFDLQYGRKNTGI